MKATREMVTATHDMLDVTYDGIGAVKDFYWHLDEWSEIEGFRVGVEHAPTDWVHRKQVKCTVDILLDNRKSNCNQLQIAIFEHANAL